MLCMITRTEVPSINQSITRLEWRQVWLQEFPVPLSLLQWLGVSARLGSRQYIIKLINNRRNYNNDGALGTGKLSTP